MLLVAELKRAFAVQRCFKLNEAKVESAHHTGASKGARLRPAIASAGSIPSLVGPAAVRFAGWGGGDRTCLDLRPVQHRGQDLSENLEPLAELT